MKLKIFMLTLVLMIALTRLTFAANLNDAEVRLICTLSSMASYNDDNGFLVREMLSSRGWSVEQFQDETARANAKTLIVSKQLDDGSLIKILSICGTADLKDAEVDFRLRRVPINSSNLSDTVPTSDDEKILVHQGFKDYSDVILADDFDKNLVAELNVHRNEKLYLTGHSLGGAVAILTAARLIDLGALKDSLQVVTFGTPAVGNKGFVKAYKDKINLTRVTVSGDPIKKSLQGLGYKHFGEVVKYKPDLSASEHFPHKMSVYLDCAIREYYDEKFSSKSQENNSESSTPNTELTYVAPMQVMKNSFSKNDFKYVKAVMKDQQKLQLKSAVYDEQQVREVDEVDELADFDDTLNDVLTKATALKCKYILVQYLQAKKIKDDRDSNYRVSLEEITYDVKGSLISMETASITTAELTLIEAAIFAQEKLIQEE